MSLLGASQLNLHYADIEIFSDVTLQVNEKAHIGIVGPNGSGKTSLIKVLLGLQDFDGGDIFKSDTLRVGYVPQTALQSGSGTLSDQISKAFEHLVQLEKDMETSAFAIQESEGTARSQAEKRYSDFLDEYESLGGYDYQNRMDRVVEGVGLSDTNLATLVSDASGGERTRAALATALLADPDLLVLDEPTNYLDFKGLEWLEDFLNRSSNAFMVVSHDRFFLDRVASEIWEIDNCQLKSYRGNYSKYKTLKSEEDARFEKEYIRQQEYIKREQNFIARYHAGQRSKEARGRAKRLDKIERMDAPSNDQTVSISSSFASRTGQTVISTDGLDVGFSNEGNQIKLFDVPDIEIERGTTTAIIGNNGIGKTTLLKTIIGDMPALSGSSNLGHNVKIGYFRQGSDEIADNITVLEALLEIKNLSIGEARSFLARFLFTGEEIYDQVSSLSGGERGRLALSRLLITEPNVLVLDEPTTHLDILSREALESMLKGFEGTTMFVSHDRHLISLLADNLLIIEDGSVRHFEGTYQELLSESNPIIQPPEDNRPVQLPAPQKPKPKSKTNHKKSKPRNNTRSKKENHEDSIANLESQIAELEEKLEEASTNGDLESISTLGKDHEELNLRLDKAISKWVE
ncbi:MAG: ABC-F family ATP-binding cassette domain-containing protein [Chloroflexota bacterium]|nr:ABC-F family ATP-binding cassette domain-containing protein [Chloroflexota bacterium]